MGVLNGRISFDSSVIFTRLCFGKDCLALIRAHRMGQERAVTVIRLVAQHTIEEKILRLHETKKELSEAILEGTDRSYKLSMDDVLDMVSPFR